jgi:hypothetical protein
MAGELAAAYTSGSQKAGNVTEAFLETKRLNVGVLTILKY